jgi:hypothetical protein
VLPGLAALGAVLRDGAHVCHHDDIRGGVLVEAIVVSCRDHGDELRRRIVEELGGTDVVVAGVRAVDWFCASMDVAGGRCIAWDAHGGARLVGCAEKSTKGWLVSQGWLAFHTEDVDVVHPMALQAADCARAFAEAIDKVVRSP